MNVWVDGWMGGWMNGWVSDWVNDWMNEWMGEWMEGWVNKWVNGWMNGVLKCTSWKENRKVALVSWAAAYGTVTPRACPGMDQPSEIFIFCCCPHLIREAVPHSRWLEAERFLSIVYSSNGWQVYGVLIPKRITWLFLVWLGL